MNRVWDHLGTALLELWNTLRYVLFVIILTQNKTKQTALICFVFDGMKICTLCLRLILVPYKLAYNRLMGNLTKFGSPYETTNGHASPYLSTQLMNIIRGPCYQITQKTTGLLLHWVFHLHHETLNDCSSEKRCEYGTKCKFECHAIMHSAPAAEASCYTH